MTDKNGKASPNPESNPNHRHLERVVDELRMVLADLGKSTPSPLPPKPEPIEETTTPPPLSKEPLRNPDPFDDLPAEAIEPQPRNSDADFWKGNVLGWSDEKETLASPEPTESINFTDPLEPETPPSSFESPRSFEDIRMEPFGGPVTSDKLQMPLNPPDLKEPPLEDAWAMNDPISAIPDLPLPPDAPAFEPFPSPEPMDSAPMSENPFVPGLTAFPGGASSFQAEPYSPPAPDTQFPIPQSLDQKPVQERPPDPDRNLETPDLKPKGHVQIACIFPAGQEKTGQLFVSKLRETGEKSKKPVTVEAVFVHPWAMDKIDIAAWKKSAILSGADSMFILVPKTNVGLFKSNGPDPLHQIKTRVIQLEHIPMKTLYADIIVDFQRGK